MPVQYDPGAGHVATALTITHTVVPSVLARIEFWILFNLHLLIGCAYRVGFITKHEDEPLFISWTHMQVITAITTFFLIFYTNTCYGKYKECYALTRQLLGVINDYCFELRLFFGLEGKQHARIASRQLVASVLLFFLHEMHDASDADFEAVAPPGILKSQERRHLKKYASYHHPTIMLYWSAEAAADGCKALNAPVQVLLRLLGRVSECRKLQQAVMDIEELQTPFPYVHLLKSMLLVNSICWAWIMALTQSIFSSVVYWIALLTFMGMMELASQLSDPFGEDEVDFPTSQWLEEFVTSAVVIMEFTSPPDHIKKALASQEKLVWNPPGLQRSTFERRGPRQSRDLPLDLSPESFDSEDTEREEDREETDMMLKPLI